MSRSFEIANAGATTSGRLRAAIFAAAPAGMLALFCAHTALAETFRVTSAADDATPGTLRWALERNNARPPRSAAINRIEIQGPLLVKLARVLPPIHGPVVIAGVGPAEERTEPGIRGSLPKTAAAIIDGSAMVDMSTTASCPAEDGKGDGPNVRSLQKPILAVVDSGGVEITGLEIRNACIGVMLLRSRDNRIHHNIIHDMVGAAGVLITGDAGDAAGSATAGRSIDNLVESNVIYDTGDGAECTRGSSRLTFRGNLFYQSSPDTVSPRSQGVECANTGNDDIRFIGNVFRGYSDGLQLNRATRVLVEGNTITDSTYGITASGTAIIRGNTIRGNRMGIGPAATAHVTITQNRIFDNGKPILALRTSAGGTTDPASPALLGIDVGVDGVTPNDNGDKCADKLPDCDTVQNYPVLSADSSWSADGKITLRGELSSRPNVPYTLEFFASEKPNAAGHAEGQFYMGTEMVTTDATGRAAFAFRPRTGDPLGDHGSRAVFTATATSTEGRTSEFSKGLPLSRSRD